MIVDDRFLSKGTFILQQVEDGYYISDLDLVVLILACFPEFTYSAFLNPKNKEQVIFHIKGDVKLLKEIIDMFFTKPDLVNKTINQRIKEKEGVINFANQMNQIRASLKGLIVKLKNMNKTEQK